MKVKEESEKIDLKLNIQKTKIMASGPITSWQIDGETMETVTDFIFLGSQITADGDYSHEIKRRLFKRHLLLGRKAMTNLHSIWKKQRHDFTNKCPSSQSYGFSSGHVWMHCEESWVPKNWCFWTVVLEMTIENPLEIQPVHPKGNQSWIFTGRTDAGAETPNTLATWCKELTHLKRPWCWERLKAGGPRDNRGWDGLMSSPTWWIWVWVSSGSWWWTGKPGILQSVGLQRFGLDWVSELNWRWDRVAQNTWPLVFRLFFSLLILFLSWVSYLQGKCLAV